jgi:hypothetical protein
MYFTQKEVQNWYSTYFTRKGSTKAGTLRILHKRKYQNLNSTYFTQKEVPKLVLYVFYTKGSKKTGIPRIF